MGFSCTAISVIYSRYFKTNFFQIQKRIPPLMKPTSKSFASLKLSMIPSFTKFLNRLEYCLLYLDIIFEMSLSLCFISKYSGLSGLYSKKASWFCLDALSKTSLISGIGRPNVRVLLSRRGSLTVQHLDGLNFLNVLMN